MCDGQVLTSATKPVLIHSRSAPCLCFVDKVILVARIAKLRGLRRIQWHVLDVRNSWLPALQARINKRKIPILQRVSISNPVRRDAIFLFDRIGIVHGRSQGRWRRLI